MFPEAGWSDDVVRDKEIYSCAASPDWASGACLLVRRSAIDLIDGFDEGFFLYCEDLDLCRRVRNAGFDIRFEPLATSSHEGGASAPRAGLLPTLAASRIRYARKHHSHYVAFLARIGVALGAFTHMVVSAGGLARRRGHAQALLRTLAISGSGRAGHVVSREGGIASRDLDLGETESSRAESEQDEQQETHLDEA